MAATQTVPQQLHNRNSELTTLRHGVLTLYGYGIQATVDRGHLVTRDGIGSQRREARFPRIGHGLRRLVVIGSDGCVSLAALRWLADQDASFVMLDRNGKVLVVTGPVSPSDARLRRAQALAFGSDKGLEIAKELIRRKLDGQERVARNRLHAPQAADTIAQHRAALESTDSLDTLRLQESRAGFAYWSAWRTLPIRFPTNDLRRVPQHWQNFGARISPLTGSPRLAVNPANAMLNYLYAILEAEARLASAALGLDPGLGFLHFDNRSRDSLACDLMEPIRPEVDAYVLDWITRESLRREWFFEERDGNCRLMSSFVQQLSESASTWSRMLAPVAEWITRALWANSRTARAQTPATRLTGAHRKQARNISVPSRVVSAPRPPRVCQMCGSAISHRHSHCKSCATKLHTKLLVAAAKSGRIIGQDEQAQARRAETQKRHEAAKKTWNTTDQPIWLNELVYREKVLPRLPEVTVRKIASVLAVSIPYASGIRSGKRVPHPRHWLALSRIVCVSRGD
jgi:CRISPR-associated endonuclease Cas1